MPNTIEQQICDAIDVLINKRVANLQFDRTVRGTIRSVEDASIGKYLVQYQDSVFYAYSDPDETYKKGAQIYVQIPSNDFNKTKRIIGAVKKLGTEYLTAVSAQDRMTKIGSNILENKKQVQFCSYTEGSQQVTLIKNNGVATSYLSVTGDDLNTYKIGAGYFLIGMTVQTKLPVEQQTGSGNYGIIIEAEYYTTAQRDSLGDNRTPITRTYVLDVNNMLGQPYKYTLPSQQYAIFTIDGNNLKGIKTIKAFCKGFPKQESGHSKDIFLSDFKINFMQPLSEAELSTSSLKILTPYGAYFTSANDDTKYLEAELKLKGKKVNFEEQKVDFYWFVRDTNISASNKLYYSSLAGQGWRCLNRSQTYDGLTQFIAQGYRKHITTSMAPAKQTTFKCVAVYNDTTLSSTIKIGNTVATTEISISSSAGTKFYFDTGKTTLTCNVATNKTNLKYYWGYRTKDGNFISLSNTTKTLNDVMISLATDLITYQCTVYSGSDRLGTAEIVLTNGVPQNEYVLVINNGTKIFKYDEYGVSPASNSVSPSNRMIIPSLSFDIYNDQGQIVTPYDNAQKEKLCDIKWIWPDKNYTMLNLKSGTGTLTEKEMVNPTTNETTYRQMLVGSATLTYEIKNKFDINATDNNIRLEVKFQGHNLVANTNFTFVKQGQLGTNGTKYTTRIVPKQNSGVNVEQYYLQSYKTQAGTTVNSIMGWSRQLKTEYNSKTQRVATTENYIFTKFNTSNETGPFQVEVWDGTNSVRKTTGDSDAKIWKILDAIDSVYDPGDQKNHYKKITPNISINDTNGKIGIKKSIVADGYTPVSTVIQATITTSVFSELAKNYYATYPLTVAKVPQGKHAIVTGGFRECMFESDGTRGSFENQPFVLRIFDSNGNTIGISNTSLIEWTTSWSTQSRTGNSVSTLRPPAVYNSERTNNYITCKYKDGTDEYEIIISVHFYLNRYGMAAMNAWDGTSIEINDKGNQYILAPQIGAGTKNASDNTFTGITMGKSFGVNGSDISSEVGLMGFRSGQRTIFLDAKTGKAVFGKSSSSQIVISPSSYGSAPGGSLYSANYWKWDRADGAPRSKTTDEVAADEKSKEEGGTGEGNGLLIDLTTPRIRFGSGKFVVSKQGHLTAKGGGTIAGWKIGNKSLKSANDKVVLYSSGQNTDETDDGAPSVTITDTFIDEKGNVTTSQRTVQERFNINNGKFVIYSDGTFKAVKNGNFQVSAEGTLTANAGSIGGWAITSNFLRSPKGDTTLYSKDSSLAYDDEAKTYQRFNINNGKFVIYKDGTFKANNGKFSVTKGGVLTSTEGHIGGWTINSSKGLISDDGKTYLNSKDNVRFNINDKFKVDYNGNLNINDKFKVDYNGNLKVNEKFYINNDGSFGANSGDFTVSNTGKLFARDGDIAGWTIGENELSHNNIHINSSGKISGNNWQINGDGYAKFTHVDITGDNTSTLNWGEGKFNVYSDGSMSARAGNIGDWIIGSGFSNSTGTVSFTPGGGLTLGSDFSVSQLGDLSAKSGMIGGCTINGTNLSGDGLTINGSGWTHNLTLVSGITGVSCTHKDVEFVTQCSITTGSTSAPCTVSGEYDGHTIWSSGTAGVSGVVTQKDIATTWFKVPTKITVSYSTKTLSILGTITNSSSSETGDGFYS